MVRNRILLQRTLRYPTQTKMATWSFFFIEQQKGYERGMSYLFTRNWKIGTCLRMQRYARICARGLHQSMAVFLSQTACATHHLQRVHSAVQCPRTVLEPVKDCTVGPRHHILGHVPRDSCQCHTHDLPLFVVPSAHVFLVLQDGTTMQLPTIGMDCGGI